MDALYMAFFSKNLIYLRERDRAPAGGGAEGEEEADFPPNPRKEPSLHPRTAEIIYMT